jgi:aconitate hydratase
VPLIFETPQDAEKIKQGNRLAILNLFEGLQSDRIEVQNLTTGAVFMTKHGLSERQIEILRAGGALNAARYEFEKHKYAKSETSDCDSD